METIDNYYNGQVKAIYDTVTNSLAANPSRKFSIVEQVFWPFSFSFSISFVIRSLWVSVVSERRFYNLAHIGVLLQMVQ